jgi:galactose mutarotase-like enzyme
MFFSVGGHPAFKLPLVEGTNYEDYEIRFSEVENAGRWPVTGEGLLGKEPILLLDNTNTLSLTKELFSKDALVFKNLKSTSLVLGSMKTPHGIEFKFNGFPFLGLWAAPSANFVCIEPWCGIADSIETDQQLTSKEGINQLLPAAVFERTWAASFF